MKNYELELKNRIEFIQNCVKASGTKGIIFANSGGKDSALAGILCKLAVEDTVSLILPGGSKRNYEQDKADALILAFQFDIQTRTIDLAPARDALIASISAETALTDLALSNISPRLRMTTMYAVANAENRLVCGTGNASEYYMGYFTKWGDGAYDFNPIGDLTVTEVIEFLKYLKAPESITSKPPSAGLFDGQTDEADMGIAYADIDCFLKTGNASEENKKIIDRYHLSSEHKRKMPRTYGA